MDDNFIAVLTDMLSLLEMGNTINPTSVLHEELKLFMLENGFISEEALKENMKKFEEDGIEYKPTS